MTQQGTQREREHTLSDPVEAPEGETEKTPEQPTLGIDETAEHTDEEGEEEGEDAAESPA